ncbi:MAG: hypothetical protein K2M82_05915, partial [Lachnospiraceae bacterium]|nr:hypothetical protein [Lachnospiraceae bacterium]
MNEKTFLMSIGIRGTILGYNAAASYSLMHGKSCFRGLISVSDGDAAEIASLIDKDFSKKLRSLLPDFLTHINTDVEFSYSYDHKLFFIDTPSIKFTVIGLNNSDGNYGGSGFLCGISEEDSSGIIAELIRLASSLVGIDTFYLYISNGEQPVDIGRLLKPFEKTSTITPPEKYYAKGGVCLYSEYTFSEKRGGLLDVFLGELLGVESLSFFVGRNADNTYLILSLPKISNNILSANNLIFEFDSAKKNTALKASGNLILAAVPELTFRISCTLTDDCLMLSAAAVSNDFVNLFGEFYLGEAALTIGYSKGLTFGIVGEIRLRRLYLFGAVQLTYNSVLRIQLLSLATSRLSLSELIENIAGIIISGLELLDKIICIDYFDFICKNKFQTKWFEDGDIPQIVSFFNENVPSDQLRLSEKYVSIKKNPSCMQTISTNEDAGGYCLMDKYRMRHYYIDKNGSLYLLPQFYYSDVQEPFEIANGMVVSAGIFFCAKICVFEKISLKVLFSFRQHEGTLAFGMLSEIDLGIIQITSSDYSQSSPIPIPDNSVLSQFLDLSSKGVAFFFQASANDVSFYFDGKISLARLFECQAQLYYQKGLVILNAESTMCGMTTHIALQVNYRNFQDASFKLSVSFDTYKLEEALENVKNRLNSAIEKCRKKINDAEQSLEDAKTKVRKLYGEIDNLNWKINQCRNRLSNMGWFKKIIYGPIIGCEIAALEIAKCAIYASIYIAEAALSVAQAAVQFAGMLGEGVLELIKGVITSVTSLFFIRKLEALLSANPQELYMQLSIDFVALGKEYNCNWTVEKALMKNSDKGHAAISDKMLNKIEPDVKDLENGVVSGTQLKRLYVNFEGYHEQEFQISDAADVLERSIEMTQFVQDAYVSEFGELLPDFEEVNGRLLENIGVIEANIDIAERATSLSEMQNTVEQLRTINTASDNEAYDIERSKINAAADAVEKYDKA